MKSTNTLDIGAMRSEARAAKLRLIRDTHSSLAIRRWCEALLDAPDILNSMTPQQVIDNIIAIDDAVISWTELAQ